jgi:hypothetical protein
MDFSTRHRGLTRRCSGGRAARFLWVLVRPFTAPLNAGVRFLSVNSREILKGDFVMNRRQICAVVVCFLALVVFANVANAQSKDRDNPTRLTSNKISSPIYVDNRDEVFYYSFEAGPGEVTATLNVDPERGGTNHVVVYFLLSETEKSLGMLNVYTWLKAEQNVERFTLSRRQMVTMKIWITSANDHSKGRYQVLLSGAVKVGQDDASSKRGLLMPPSSKDKTSSSDCLPKQGTLIIKMKDGSKKIIDLSEAETITVVP